MIDRRFLLAATAGLIGTRALAQTTDPQGSWTGVLTVGSTFLRLRLVIGDGTAQLYSLDQGDQAIPATVVSLTPQRIELEFPSIQGRYTGAMAGTDRIEGEFSQGRALPLAFLRGEAGLAAAIAPLTDAEIEQIRGQASPPALTAAARAGNGAPKIWVSGHRAAGSGVAATKDDLWHLGSITKSMTATLVGRLVDAGKVRWDDKVGAALAGVAPDMRAEYRDVTFRHLLSHRSGLPANLPVADLLGFTRELDDPRRERLTFVKKALALDPVGSAGSTYTYSNNGYVLAGVMLELATGRSWETLIREQLFAPLGLRSAGIGAPGRAGVLEQPSGHGPGPGTPLVPYPVGSPVTDNPAAVGPAGRVHMSMADVLTYLSAHRDRTPFLKAETWRTLHTVPFGGNYAMGWIVKPDGALWHNGSNTLWYAEVTVDFRAGKVAAAATNSAGPTSEAAVAKALAGALAAV